MFPLDFLKTIGQGIGGGVKKVGQGIIPKGPDPLMRTPGFVPDGAAKAGGILPGIARPSLPTIPAPTQGIIPTAPQQMPGTMPLAREVAPPMDLDRRGVPLPALPGESGPKEYSRMEEARYDHHRSRMRQPGDEKYDGTGQYKRSGKDVLRNALMGFFQGAAADPRNPLAGGLGGALVGGAGTAISPQGGAEYGFNTMVRPQIERQMADEAVNQKLKDEQLSREQAAQRAQWEAEARPVRLEGERADIEYRRAQADAARAGMKDAGLTRRKQEADIALAEARTEAVAKGRPSYRDVVGEDGTVRTVQVFPDGSMIDLGESGRAAMQTERLGVQKEIATDRNASSMDRTRLQQSGAMARTQAQQLGAMNRAQLSQTGQDRRLGQAEQGRTARQTIRTTGQAPAMPQPQAKAQGGGKVFPASRLEAFARSKGMSIEQAQQYITGQGYEVR